MGGWIGLHLCLARPDRVRGFVGIAPAPDFTQRKWESLSEAERQQLEEHGVLRNFTYTFTKKLLEDGQSRLLLDKPGGIDITCPVRLIHGMDDDAVAWSVSAQILEKVASKDATLTLIKGGDHRLSSPAELVRMQRVVTDLCNLVGLER
eukprot:jgi/Mesen1/7135/ME000369S06453